jgi:hypothetical protein
MKHRFFYTVDFIDNRTGQQLFRLMTAKISANHDRRMAEFQEELGDRFTITAYDLDMSAGEMLDNGITCQVFRDTYWDRALVGAA